MQEQRAKFGITRLEGAFKTVLNAASWSAGGTLGTARYVAGATGDTSAGLICWRNT